MLPNGPYDIQVTAQDVRVNIYSTQITVNVTQNAKIGNFHLEYTDLSVPLAGIPITITRTYDTLQANQSGAFGFGWSLGVDNPNLQERKKREHSGLSAEILNVPVSPHTGIDTTESPPATKPHCRAASTALKATASTAGRKHRRSCHRIQRQ